MADCTFWHNLAEEFQNLDPGHGLSIRWQKTLSVRQRCDSEVEDEKEVPPLSDHYSYRLDGGSEFLRLSFRRLAQKAVVALEASDDTFGIWCSKLRSDYTDPRTTLAPLAPEVLDDGTRLYHQSGWIPKACEASASLCKVLEMREVEIDLKTVPEGAVPTVPSQAEADPFKSRVNTGVVDTAGGSGLERLRPGPKPDRETARRVKDIVSDLAGGTRLRANLDKICEALDEAGVPCPKTWNKREFKIRSWTDAAATDADLAKKAIEHRLRIAQN